MILLVILPKHHLINSQKYAKSIKQKYFKQQNFGLFSNLVVLDNPKQKILYSTIKEPGGVLYVKDNAAPLLIRRVDDLYKNRRHE